WPPPRDAAGPSRPRWRWRGVAGRRRGAAGPAAWKVRKSMAMFSPQLLNHFQQPRNVGEVEQASAVAEVENPVCGDVLRLTLKIEADQIVAARFRAQGCVASMACASFGAEF